MRKILLILCLISSLPSFGASPFDIPFPAKKDMTNEDYIELNKQISQVDIRPLITAMYEPIKGKGFTTFDDFFGRCIKSTRQILIDPAKGLYPEKCLVQIGKGGDRCVVCSVPLSGKYPHYVRSLVSALESVGFNGSFLYYIGGWPNPTGEEVKFAAVPYSCKIFAMVEAYLLGFNNVLWIDASCYPLRNIEPLFDIISSNGSLLNTSNCASDSWRVIFPQTRELLQNLTGTDVLNTRYLNSIVMGFKMSDPKAQEFVKTYYEMARLGTPFLSCFPEEWVFTAIIGQKKFQRWAKKPHPSLIRGSPTNQADSSTEFDLVRKTGTYFYHRKGR